MYNNINYFNFKRLEDQYLLTNDAGRFIFLKPDEFKTLMQNNTIEGALSEGLERNFFTFSSHREIFVDNASIEVRKQKSYLFEKTQLHIFVVTMDCNQKCIYCQASANENANNGKQMSMETAEKAVNIAFQSPAKNLSFEFQGGEPLLNFQVIKHIVEYTKRLNIDNQKNITFNVVTNTIAMDDSILEYFISNKISICTSIDGDRALQNKNRPCSIVDFYDTIVNNICKVNRISLESNGSYGRIQALQTTSKHSLRYAKDIVDTYIELGFSSLFIRPLTPLGFAKERWDKIGYTAEEFIIFYKEVLEYIIELSLSGVRISETYTIILLKKILGNSALNFMELRSPCGGSIGQLAYHYNGCVYTCDEGRMLSESGDDSFKLGDVYSSTYRQLLENPVTKALCISSCIETIPGCNDCVYSPYCGICPIYNYAQERSIFALMPANYKCKINKGIMDYLFKKIKQNDTKVMEIFQTWINN